MKCSLFSARKCKNINYLISYCRHILTRIPVPTGEKFKVNARAFCITTWHQRMTSNKLVLFVCREKLELSNYLSGNNQYLNAQLMLRISHRWVSLSHCTCTQISWGCRVQCFEPCLYLTTCLQCLNYFVTAEKSFWIKCNFEIHKKHLS